jgi:predicted PurR-regulated permease PerM
VESESTTAADVVAGTADEKAAKPTVLSAPVSVQGFAFIGLAMIGLAFLRFAQELFIPVVLGILISFALAPVVTWLTWMRVPRVLAAAVVIIGSIGLLGSGVYALRGQAAAVIEKLPEAAQEFRLRIQEMRRQPADDSDTLSKIKEAAEEIEKTAAVAVGTSEEAPRRGVTKVQIEEPAFRANDWLWFGSLSILGLLSQAVMVAFLVFFMLASGDLFKRKLVRLIGSTLSEKRVTLEAINEINSQIGRFLLIQIATGALVGVCTTLALWAFGVRQAAVWGVAAGVLNSIPYFGAILVTVGLAFVAFLQFGSLLVTAKIAGTALAITGLEGFLLTPALMGKAAQINGVAMFLSLLFWSWLWGVIGTIVAVPLMMAIKIACDRIEGLEGIGDLLGER